MITIPGRSLRNISRESRPAVRRRLGEAAMLVGTSLAFLFALAVAFGFISG